LFRSIQKRYIRVHFSNICSKKISLLDDSI
jgi:hypothetical protein